MSAFTNSPDDWREHQAAMEEDLDNFEEYAWPAFKRRGFSRDAAVMCHFLMMFAAELTEGDDDGDDFLKGSS